MIWLRCDWLSQSVRESDFLVPSLATAAVAPLSDWLPLTRGCNLMRICRWRFAICAHTLWLDRNQFPVSESLVVWSLTGTQVKNQSSLTGQAQSCLIGLYLPWVLGNGEHWATVGHHRWPWQWHGTLIDRGITVVRIYFFFLCYCFCLFVCLCLGLIPLSCTATCNMPTVASLTTWHNLPHRLPDIIRLISWSNS